jgi:hypothetical protein
MPVRLLLELLVHHDSMVVVTAVEAVVEFNLAVLEPLAGTVEFLVAVAGVAVWAKVHRELVVLVVKAREVR